jgi:hypothetical protein
MVDGSVLGEAGDREKQGEEEGKGKARSAHAGALKLLTFSSGRGRLRGEPGL